MSEVLKYGEQYSKDEAGPKLDSFVKKSTEELVTQKRKEAEGPYKAWLNTAKAPFLKVLLRYAQVKKYSNMLKEELVTQVATHYPTVQQLNAAKLAVGLTDKNGDELLKGTKDPSESASQGGGGGEQKRHKVGSKTKKSSTKTSKKKGSDDVQHEEMDVASGRGDELPTRINPKRKRNSRGEDVSLFDLDSILEEEEANKALTEEIRARQILAQAKGKSLCQLCARNYRKLESCECLKNSDMEVEVV